MQEARQLVADLLIVWDTLVLTVQDRVANAAASIHKVVLEMRVSAKSECECAMSLGGTQP
jgi:hypothetical protein